MSVLIFFVCCGIVRFLFNTAYYDVDLSYRNGYHFLGVPLTEKLVQSLKNCTTYRIKYSERLFQQFWTNSWGEQDILLIGPQPDGSCRITKKESNMFAAGSTTEFDVEIPMALAQKSGEILYIYLHDLREKEAELKNFHYCLNGCLLLDEDYAQYDISDIFLVGAPFIADSMRDYWQHWNVSDKKPYIASAEQIKAEKQVCVQTHNKLKQLIRNRKFQQKDDFYQGKWMYNLVDSDDFYILPGGENGKWNMGFMLANSACFVEASLDGNDRYTFKQVIKSDPIDCKCW